MPHFNLRKKTDQLVKKDYFRLFCLLLVFLGLQLYLLFFFYHDYKAASSTNRWFSFSQVFYARSIFAGMLLHPVLLVALAAVYFPVFFKKVSFDFSAEYRRIVRVVVFVPACLLTWEIVTYDQNYFLGSAFLFDRFLLIVLTAALWRYPVLVPLYIAYFLVYRSQFNYPMGGFMLIDKKILIDLLVVFTAWNIVKRFVPLLPVHLLLLVFCIPASHYFFSGLAKVLISPNGSEWMSGNNLNDFFFNAYGRGWMNNLAKQDLLKVHSFFDGWSTFIQWGAFLTETGMLFILWRKKTAVLLLTACLLMHMAIFLAGSMLFWKWMAIDLLLIALIVFSGQKIKELFTRQHFLYAIPVILLSFVWLRPSRIAWHDTPFNQFFTFEALDACGNTTILSRNDFEPYHQLFQIDRFVYLVNGRTLPVSGFGYTFAYPLATSIKNAGPKGIPRLEEQQGRNFFNTQQRNVFVNFIQVFFHARNRVRNSHPWLYYLHAPHHLYASAPKAGRLLPCDIVQVRVYFDKTWRQGHRLLPIGRKTCEIIAIPG